MGKPDGKHNSGKKDGAARKAAADKKIREDKIQKALVRDLRGIIKKGNK